MWRVVVIVIAVVVATDLMLLFGGPHELDYNMGQISSAMKARAENPSPETQRALIAALDKGFQMNQMARFGYNVAMLVVTNVGLFVAGFLAGRGRSTTGNSLAANNAAPNI